MKIIDRLIILSISLSSMVMAQLPFFLQRFRPVRHSLLSSGSSAYPSFASSLFPSSSLLSPTYGAHSSLLGGSSFSSPFSSSALSSLSLSSPFTASASSLSPHFGTSFTSSNLATSLLSSPTFSSPSLAGSHFSRSPSFASSYLAGSPSFSSSYLGGSANLAPSHLSSPHKLSASNLAHSLVDLGTIGNFDGIGGFDQAELVDDYQGLSSAGFGKDLSFAGSQAVKVQTPAQYGNDVVYLQRTNEENDKQE